jgi:hypothetical protein
MSDDEERERLRAKLAARFDSDGVVQAVASDRRSEQQNRYAADNGWLASSNTHSTHRKRAPRPSSRGRGTGDGGRRERIAAREAGDGVSAGVARMA